MDYDNNTGIESNNLFKNDEHLTAFGLALMQNGFPSPNAILNSQTFQTNKQQQQNTTDGSINNVPNNNAESNTISEKWSTQHHNDDRNVWNNKSQTFIATQKTLK